MIGSDIGDWIGGNGFPDSGFSPLDCLVPSGQRELHVRDYDLVGAKRAVYNDFGAMVSCEFIARLEGADGYRVESAALDELDVSGHGLVLILLEN